MTNALFHGIIPPVLTPLLDGDTLDRQGLDNVLERLLTGGVQGLFLLGTTGEGPSLSYRLRRELVTHALKSIGSRVPVMIGITDTPIEESLRMADFAAENGAQALHAFLEKTYNLILMDVQMPVMDGYEATTEIRKAEAQKRGRKRIPIVAMTANVFKDDIDKCYAAGMNGHVGKPLDLDEVLEKLQQYLYRGGDIA